ncbi:MAG: hypothetical protein LC802_19040 [Acidobacteria bacterium]|nr:hypothetical protein [Acidobacteriota bacterium]
MMNFRRAFLAGVVGGLVMTIIMALVRATMMPQANPEMMLGTMTGSEASTTTWVMGLVIHLILSGMIALVYALGFEYVMHRAGVLIGLGFAIIHIFIGGIVMGMMPMMHPMIPEKMMPPGAFMSGMGMMGTGLFVLEHLIYGAIVGTMYKPVHGELGTRVEA